MRPSRCASIEAAWRLPPSVSVETLIRRRLQRRGAVAALERLDVGAGQGAAAEGDFVGAGDCRRLRLRSAPIFDRALKGGLHLGRRRVVGQFGRRLAAETELEFAFGGFDVDQLDLVGPRGTRQAFGFVGVRVGGGRPVFEPAVRHLGVVGVDAAFQEVAAQPV